MTNQEKQEFDNLKRKVDELERLFKFHNHYGYDKTRIVDGDIKIKSNRFFQLGKTYQGNNNIFEGLATETNRWLLAAGEELDLIITSVSGTPTWVSSCWK